MTGILTLEAIDCVAIDKYIEENKLALAYFGDFTGDLWEAYNELPKEESLANMYGFFHTIDTSCGEKYGVSGEGLMVHRSFDEPNVVYSGDQTVSAISDWSRATAIPTLIKFNEDHIQFIFGDLMPALVLFCNETVYQAYWLKYKEAAKELKGEILFVIVHLNDDPESI